MNTAAPPPSNNPFAIKLRQAGFELEDTNIPEISSMLLVAANEIDRLEQALKDRAIEQVQMEARYLREIKDLKNAD